MPVVRQFYEDFVNKQQVIITHGRGYLPLVRVAIVHDSEVVLAMTEIIVTMTTITINFAPYTATGRITYA